MQSQRLRAQPLFPRGARSAISLALPFHASCHIPLLIVLCCCCPNAPQELIRRQQEIKDARRVYEKMDGMPNEEDMPEI